MRGGWCGVSFSRVVVGTSCAICTASFVPSVKKRVWFEACPRASARILAASGSCTIPTLWPHPTSLSTSLATGLARQSSAGSAFCTISASTLASTSTKRTEKVWSVKKNVCEKRLLLSGLQKGLCHALGSVADALSPGSRVHTLDKERLQPD